MNDTIAIRQETPDDYRLVEEITRKAFWNLYIPGCFEHYLAHTIRPHKDFLPELDLVIEYNGQVVGNIMYTKTTLADEEGRRKSILTFGPVCILPEFQRRGLGKRLMERSFEIARSLGYEAIVIFGNPDNYVSRGFKSCHKFHVSLEDGSYPAAMMVKELITNALGDKKWIYYQSPAFDSLDEQEAERFDAAFEPMEKCWQPSQEEFYIHSHSFIQA